MTTKERFETGIKIGDRFSEMYSIWIVILNILPDGKIHTIEGNKDNLELMEYQNVEELNKKMSYNSIEGYWIRFIDNNTNRLSEFINYFKEIRENKLNSPRLSEQDIKALYRQKQIEKLIFNI